MTRAMADCRLPADALLLPLSDGALLVSRKAAVFCRIPAEHVADVQDVLADSGDAGGLSPELIEDMRRHACFAPPRPESPAPRTVQLQITNACNLACAYCCTNSGPARRREVTFEQMLDVVRRIPEVLGPATSVAILGGEPLLIPWALDLAEAIVEQGLSLTVFTNGLPLIEEPLARRMAELMARGVNVRISLAGAGPSSCDAVSGTPRFGPVLDAVRQLVRFGGKPALDVMLIPGLLDDIVAELPSLRRGLPPGIKLSLGVLYRSGRETGERLFRSRRELEAALDRVAFETGECIPATKSRPVMERRDGCSCALGRHVHVRSDGGVFNCFKMEEKVGDLFREGFVAAAQDIAAHPHRATALPVCSDCPLATLCGGGCRSENLLYTGDPDCPPCGPWRVRTLSELLAEDCVSAVDWPLAFLLEEARARGIEPPPDLEPKHMSRHLLDT